jgi:predicted RNA polymerase sigma factor
MLRDRPRAEEITQDAFIQLFLGWPKISPIEFAH